MKKVLFLFLFFLFSGSAFAAEEILNYDTEITVRTDASVIVRERITVQREGKKIKRGIYRDLPKTKGVTYDVLSVRRDNQPEPYFTENTGSYFRINTGNDDFLPHDGVYTFEITYRAENVISGFDDYDELYWNVTGDRWQFPIRKASARVILPDNIPVLQQASYIGKKGSKEKGRYENGVFTAGRALKSKEGFTIAAGFQKGIVNIPVLPFYDQVPLTKTFRLSAVILLGYLFITWFFFGKDPKKEAVMPRFKGLPDLTPAQAGWIYSYGKNKDGCFSAALLQGCISGFLSIKEKSSFHISRLRDGENGEEKYFEQNLKFPLTLSGTYTPTMEKFLKDFCSFLDRKTGEKYFNSHTPFVIFGLLLLVGLTIYQCYQLNALPLSFVMAFYMIFLIPVGKSILKMISSGVISYMPIVVLLFIAAHFYMIMTTTYTVDHIHQIILFYVIGALALLIYAHLIILPTEEGMQVIAYMDGIKMFLTTVDTGMPQEVDFDKMERLLPYAVLLGLEKEWAEKMQQIFAQMTYKPQWYSGRPFSSARFADGLRTAVAGSCLRPSKSGSGGGGFSGGGFGGGGGGGR